MKLKLFAMKGKVKKLRLEAATAGKKKYSHYFSFKKKDNTVRNLELLVACVIVFMAGMGIYEAL